MALNKNVLENARRSFFHLKEKYIQDLEREQKKFPLFRKIKLKKMRESYLRKLNFRKKDLDTFFNEYPLSKKGIYFIEKKFLEKEILLLGSAHNGGGFSFMLILAITYFIIVVLFCLKFHKLLMGSI